MRTYRLIIIPILLIGCKAAPPTSSGAYSEDLKIHRPVSSVELGEKQNEENDDEVVQENYKPLEGHIKAELDSIAKISYLQNKEGRYVDGYIIQVYSGNSREDANTARNKMDSLFPKLEPKISYRQPSFRVKAGKFINRLEAHRIYNDVKAEFPRALLLPERFLMSYE
ncbi:MAG: SPOR domain-containing protein [Bacteroidota bacterium]